MMSEKEDPILLRYMEDPAYTQGLKGMQDEIDNYFISAAEKMLKTKTRSYGFLGLRNIRIAFRRIGHTRELKDIYGDIDWDLFERILTCGRDRVDKLYFIYIPDYARFYKPELANPHREEILERVRKLGIPIIDIYDVFMQYDDPLDFYPFRMRNHFNEKGYRVIAEKLLEVLD